MRIFTIILIFSIFNIISTAQVNLVPLEFNPDIQKVFQESNVDLQKDFASKTGNAWYASATLRLDCPNPLEGVTYILSGNTVFTTIDTIDQNGNPGTLRCLNCSDFSNGSVSLDTAVLYFEADPGIILEEFMVEIEFCNSINICDTLLYPFVIKRAGNTVYPDPIMIQPDSSELVCIPVDDLPGNLYCNYIDYCEDTYDGEGQQEIHFSMPWGPDNCLYYRAGRFPGTDTVCVILCDDYTVCDTFKLRFEIEGDTLQLPFFDDFAYHGPYPSKEWWLDDFVYVNASMGSKPPSVGYATFDGIDDTGIPYGTPEGVADILTSKPLDLSQLNENSNVVLSFYLQPKGFGFLPRIQDSIILEFKNDSARWNTITAIPGLNFIPADSVPPFSFYPFEILDEQYFYNGFQFRIKNLNPNKGAYSPWHLDYVLLDANRDTVEGYEDVAFSELPNFILKNYRAMPIAQFRDFESEELADEVRASFFNNFKVTKAIGDNRAYVQEDFSEISYPTFTIVDALNIPSLTFDEREKSIPTGVNGTIQNGIKNDFSGLDKLHLSLNYELEVTDQQLNVQANDTIKRVTVLDNYFAYDDGTAERAIEANGVGTQIVVEFDLNKTDSLRAVQFNFPRISGDVQDQLFNLHVWTGKNSLDEFNEPSYRAIFLKPYYPTNIADTIQGFTTYLIYDPQNPDQPQPLELQAGKFFIGWEQATNTGNPFPVGFDMNNPNVNHKNWYNAGQGWFTLEDLGLLSGAIMIRPVFGSETPIPTNVETISQELPAVDVFPVPADDYIQIQSKEKELSQFEIVLIDGLGKIYYPYADFGRIDVKSYPSGLYHLILHSREDNIQLVKKVIIMHK